MIAPKKPKPARKAAISEMVIDRFRKRLSGRIGSLARDSTHTKSAEKARGWYERRGIQGVVAVRPLAEEKERTAPVVFASGYDTSFWGYYGYGWSSVYAVPVGSRVTTTIVVETLVYDATRDRLAWRATSDCTAMTATRGQWFTQAAALTN